MKFLKYVIIIGCWAVFFIMSFTVNAVMQNNLLISLITIGLFSAVGILIGVKTALPGVKVYLDKSRDE